MGREDQRDRCGGQAGAVERRADAVVLLLRPQAAKKAALKGTQATALKKVRHSVTFHRCVLLSSRPAASRERRPTRRRRPAARADRVSSSPLSSRLSSCTIHDSPARPRHAPMRHSPLLLDRRRRRLAPTRPSSRTASPLPPPRRAHPTPPEPPSSMHLSAAPRPSPSPVRPSTSARRSRRCRAWTRTARSCTRSTPSRP